MVNVPSVITLPAASKAPMLCFPTLNTRHREELETVLADSQLPSACCTKSTATVVGVPGTPSSSDVTSVEPAKDADNWMASLTSTAGAEQLKLDGSIVVTPIENGAGVS